jgi:predicted O-methyltransferase YrrM
VHCFLSRLLTQDAAFVLDDTGQNMDIADYNYAAFEASLQEFFDFAMNAPKVTTRAPSFPIEDLATGENIEMRDLWRSGAVIIEFGSFT